VAYVAKKAGRPQNLAETKSITISVPQRLHDYLALLAYKSVLGGSAADVAAYILKSRVSEMIDQKFHERQTYDSSDEGS
jgi:hypothetical protein